jgi:hypothetical protein
MLLTMIIFIRFCYEFIICVNQRLVSRSPGKKYLYIFSNSDIRDITIHTSDHWRYFAIHIFIFVKL